MNSAVTHDVITVALPFLAILAGTLFNNRAIAKVEAEMKAFRDETRSEIKDVRSEIKDVRSEIKDVRSEIKDVRNEIKELRAAMEKRFDRVDDHLTRLHSITGEHEGRLQALERQG